MARAKEDARSETGLYDRDFYLWVQEQSRLLREAKFDELDLTNLIDEIDD